MADKTYNLRFDLSDGTSKTVQFTSPQGATGERGTGILKVTTAPTSYTTATGGKNPIKRMSLSTIKTQANVDEVLVGDQISHSYYLYHIYYLDATYAYMDTYQSIRGATGSKGDDGAKGADGKDGASGVYVGEMEPTDETANVWINPESGVAIIPTIEHNTCAIFKKVVCVGDSFTSGHIQTGEESVSTNEEYAWPSYLARLTGNEYVNCGSSGATTITWLTHSRGLAKAQSTGVVQAYLVGLGLNDVWNVDLGTADDIGTDAQTYYGGLSRVIRELNAISPKAKIFVQTMASDSSGNVNFNAAIREVVDAYSGTYPVHVLDLAAYLPMYKTDLILGDKINGHYTAIGYQMFAENLRVIWSEYINNHIAEFQDVYTLPYGTA